MASTSVKVALRVRPLSPKEVLASAQECVGFLGPGIPQVSIAPTNSTSVAESLGLSGGGAGAGSSAKSFTFDHVFDTLSTQEEVYEECVRPLVDRFLEGFNATVLAYGQTGSGKTHSMGTGLETAAEPGSEGIVPRAIYYLFDKLQGQGAASPEGFKYDVSVSFLELYNEEIIDLLLPRAKDGSSAANPNALSIREDGSGKIRWYGVKEQVVTSPEDLLMVLEKGSLCRTTGSTDMNASSSRSHAIFSVILKQQKWAGPEGTTASTETAAAANDEGNETVQPSETDMVLTTTVDPLTHLDGSFQTILSKFHFVDLAGSERLKRTNAEGDRKKEGISINQGLLALGNVISALGDDTRRSANSHVPYRDSKLTRMLQDSLGGNSQTLMLACVSPSDTNYAETLNTLNYANRARNIKNKVVINQEWAGGNANSIAMEREIRMLRATVSQLRSEMQGDGGARLPSGGGDPLAAGYLSSQRRIVSGGMRDRDAQIRLQRERDLENEVDEMRREREAIRFENDRLKFRCFRLQDRCRDLGKELTDAVVRRDEVIIAYGQTLAPGKKRKGARQENDGGIKVRKVWEEADTSRREAVRSNDEIYSDVENDDDDTLVAREGYDLLKETEEQTASRRQITAHPIIQSYARTISDLTFRLSEAEDKITWYNDVVARLGGKGRNNKNAFSAPSRGGDGGLWTEDEIGNEANKDLVVDVELGIPSKPLLPQLVEVEAAEDAVDMVEAAGEKRVLKAMSHVGNHPEESEATDEADGVTSGPKGPKLYGIPNALSLVREPSSLFSSDADVPAEDGSNTLEESTEDMFSVIAKIQSDIAEHEKLVSRIQHRDAEYETMRTAYEQKLRDLQTQLMQSKKERDLALQKMQDGGKQQEKKGTIAIKQRYEDKRRQLERQIDEYKRRLADTSRTRDERRGKDEGLMRGLKETITSMKVEKTRMLKDLKKERERARSLEMNSRREIANLRRKERKAVDLVKKLEYKSQLQLQRVTMQRRTDDARDRKSVMKILKRTTTPHRISKSGTSSGSASPKRRSMSHGTWKVTTAAETRPGTTTSMPVRRVIANSTKAGGKTSPDARAASAVELDGSLTVRAALRKEMLDKELESCVTLRRAQKEVESLQIPLNKLVGEQKVLLDEREKVVRAEEARTGRYEPDAWQYMDGRLAELDQAIAVISGNLQKAQDLIKRAQAAGQTPSSYNAQPVDLGWENAMDLLRTVDPFELEAVAELYLDEVVGLRHALEESQAKNSEQHTRLKEKEALVVDLTNSVKHLKAECKKRDEEIWKAAEAAAAAMEQKVRLETTDSTEQVDEGSPGDLLKPPKPARKLSKKNAWSDIVKSTAMQMDAMDIASEQGSDDDDIPAVVSVAEPRQNEPARYGRCVEESLPQPEESVDRMDVVLPHVLSRPKNTAPTASGSQPATARPAPSSPKKGLPVEQLSDDPPKLSFLDRLALLGGGELAKKWSKGGRSFSSDDSKENNQPIPNSGPRPQSSSPPSSNRPESSSPNTKPDLRTSPRGRGHTPPPLNLTIPANRQLHPNQSQHANTLPRSVSVSPSKSSSYLGLEDAGSSPTSPTGAASDRDRHHRSPSWACGRDSPRRSVAGVNPTKTYGLTVSPEKSNKASASPSASPTKRSHHSSQDALSQPSIAQSLSENAADAIGEKTLPPPAVAPAAPIPLRAGADVFERLAHAHTLASQAKVIHRGMDPLPPAVNPTSAAGAAAPLSMTTNLAAEEPDAVRQPRRKISGTDN